MRSRGKIKLILCISGLLNGIVPVLAQGTTGVEDSLYHLGEVSQMQKRDYPAALSRYRQLLALDRAAHRYQETIRDYSSILNLYFYIGDYPEAMKAATEELSLAEDQNDSLRVARVYSTIGFIYFRQGDTNASRYYYTLYLNLTQKAKDSFLMADGYSDIGEVETSAGRYPEAMAALFKAYALYEGLGNAEYLINTCYLISRVYKDMGNYTEALQYARRSVKNIETTPSNEYDKARYYINAGDVYKNLAEPDTALEMTHRGLDIALWIRHREDELEAWHTLAGIYALQRRYDSAYRYDRLYSDLKDSITNERTQGAIERIHEQYAVERKDREIALQKAELARQSLLKNIFLSAFVLLIGFILLLYNRRRLKQRAEQERELSRQRNEQFGAVIMAQENERTRIAQDIHDTVGSLVSAAKLNLSALDEERISSDPEQARRYKVSLQLLDEVSTELRNVAHNIMPGGLSKLGLPAAVKGLLDTLSAPSGLAINYSAYGFDERLPEGAEISIYRILLELINNVIKHSRASLLTVQLIRYPEYINLVVEDNGVGFSRGRSKGMGLGNILSRVKYLKGTMDIDSKEGAGTTVFIEIPC